MKKEYGVSIAVASIIFFMIGCQPIKHSKTYVFTTAVLDSLSNIQLAQEEANNIKSINDLSSGLKKQISHFQSAKNKISAYLNDKDKVYNTVAKGMITGIDGLIKVNNESIDLLKSEIPDGPEIEKELKEKNRKLNYMQQESYKILGLSASFVGYAIFSPSKTTNPKGLIPYNMTDDERKILLSKINTVFGKNLDKYYIYRADHSKGDPSDQNWTIFAVDNIKNYLIPDTYEEAKKLAGERLKK